MRYFWYGLQIAIAATFIYWCDTHLTKAERGSLMAESLVGLMLGYCITSLLLWLRRLRQQ